MDKNSDGASSDSLEDTHLVIKSAETHIPKYFSLLQSGFMMKVVSGVTIKAFLCEQVGLPEDYFEDRIQTLFLNSKPVDDAATACIENGSRLALSAAMPGVAGALFRKDGKYSAMRKGISCASQNVISDDEAGWVTIKLFNLILKELGSFFLAKGVWIDGKAVQHFFNRSSQAFLDGILQIEINANTIEPAELLTYEWSEKRILLKIESK
jgi:hypothetical protein